MIYFFKATPEEVRQHINDNPKWAFYTVLSSLWCANGRYYYDNLLHVKLDGTTIVYDHAIRDQNTIYFENCITIDFNPILTGKSKECSVAY